MQTAFGHKWRSYSLAFGCLAVLGISASPALAQDETVEEITVTGSRIARDPNLGAPVAVQSVTSEDIQLSGQMDVTEVVRDIPALISSNTLDASNLGDGGEGFDTGGGVVDSTGEAVLQLRGMGLERTLVLVDGRRHVAGAAGTQAVDINSIPQPLIERVEVLTGGASAIYGADAVTGVVNFIMKDDFDGLEFDAQGGISSRGDGTDFRIAGVWGKNFNNDRTNFTIAVDYRKREHLFQGDRDWSRDNGIGSDDNNPALRFQVGDIGASTPNFQQFYSTANGYYPFGLRIPTADDFIADFEDEFGTTPTLTAEEAALINRAATSPTRLIARHRTFSISSEHGVIVPGDFLFSNVDVDNDGTEDCLQSFLGYNSLFEGKAAFGLTGGCWNNVNGNPQIYQDGAVAGNFNQFGGDGIHAFGFDEDYLTPNDEKIVLNISANHQITDLVRVFGEAKYVTQDTKYGGPNVAFYDLLTIAPDNPFIPAVLQPVADRDGGVGLFITRDPIDLGDGYDKNERETMRFVLGLDGEFGDGWTWEVYGNYGQTEITSFDNHDTIMDRYFAGIDATTDANGNPICRSDVDPTPPPTTIFDLPLFDPGFFTFNPGDGSCVPLNILGGAHSASQEAINWIMRTSTHRYKIEQTVFSGLVTGDLGFGLSAGDIRFAGGVEYRDEQSQSTFDDWVRGVLPVTTPDGNQGDLIRDLGVRQTSLMFDPEFLVNNTSAGFDVWEVFGEVEVPLLSGATMAEDLSVNAAFRYSDYSTVGGTNTWQFGTSWTPVQDIRFRGTVSRAIRAPNIAELFQPEQAATFRPIEPCEQSEIDTLIANGDPRGQIRATNCQADGIPPGFSDPLSARFTGVTAGNPALSEEEADTITAGFVLSPTFLEGFSMSVDWWRIDIENAIDFVGDQDIVDNCYDSATFPNQFCDLFTRDRDPASPQFLGLNFLRQTRLNFGKLESAGVDFKADYGFDISSSSFVVGAQGTWVDYLNKFFDPGDPTAVDPELGELRRPRLAGTIYANWSLGDVFVRWQSMYQESQGLADVEIETADFVYGPAGFSGDFWGHDISASYGINDNLLVYGGINNVTDEIPFLTEIAYPINPRGRQFFLGVNYRTN